MNFLIVEFRYKFRCFNDVLSVIKIFILMWENFVKVNVIIFYCELVFKLGLWKLILGLVFGML